MIAFPAPYVYDTSQKRIDRAEFRNKLRGLIVLLMASSKRKHNPDLLKDPSTWEQRLNDYLDGYFMSLDMHPVCERHLFIRNDAYALLHDFWSVANDMNKATRDFVAAPDEGSADHKVAEDEIRQRRIKAAQKALSAIKRKRHPVDP